MATETVITKRNRQTLQTQKTLPTQLTLPTQKTQVTPPTLTTLPTNMERTVQQQSFYSDYNDPYQLNSLADAVLNNEAIKRASEGWGWFSWVEEVPLLRNIGAIVDVTYNTGIKPILKGDWKAAGVNALMNLGETMDVIANPVKGLLMEGGSGLIKGLGVGKDGRVNYDWDTGSWIADIGLELVTDPLNWISFGGKAVISAGAKAGAKEAMAEVTEKLVREAAQQLAEQAGKELTEEVIQELTERVSKKLIKSAQKTLVDITTDAIQDEAVRQVKRLAKHGVKTTKDAIVKDLLLERTDYLKGIILDELIKSAPDTAKTLLKNTDSILFKNISKNIDSVLSSLKWDSMTHSINTAVAKLYNISEGFEKFLFKSVITTSGLGLGWKALKPVFELGSKFLGNTVFRNLRKAKYIDKNNVIDIFNWDKVKALYSQSYKLARTVNAEDVVRADDALFRWAYMQLNTDVVEMTKLYTDNIKNIDVASAALENYVKLRYTKHSLASYIRELKRINLEENGFFDKQIRALERLQRLVKSAPGKKLIGQNTREVSQLVSAAALEASEENYEELLKVLEKIYDGAPIEQQARQTITYFADTSYQRAKYEEFTVQQKVIQHPAVQVLFKDIAEGTDETIGCTIQNILQDKKMLGTKLHATAQHINDVVNTVQAYQTFIQDILNTTYTIQGASLKELQNVIVEKLFSLRKYSAQDVINNPDLLSNLLINEIEVTLNAMHKTSVAGKRIYLDSTTRELIQDQLLQYAYTLQSYNSAYKLTYVIDRDFTKALTELYNDLKNANPLINFETVDYALVGIRTTLIETREFNSSAALFTNTTFAKLKEIDAQYALGHASIGELLLKDTHGRNLYAWHEVLNTKHLNELFSFIEAEEYGVSVLKQAETFTTSYLERLKTIDFSKLDDTTIKAIDAQATLGLSRILGSFQSLSYAQKLEFPNLAFLDYMNHTHVLQLDTTKKIAILQTLQDTASNTNNAFLQNALRDSLPESFKNYIYGRKLKKASTVTFNPASLLTDAQNTQFSDTLRQAVNDYEDLTSNVDQIINNIEARTALKRSTEKASPIVYTNERYVKRMSNVQNNVFRYTENKMRDLFDSASAQKYLDYFRQEDPEIYEYLVQLYTGSIVDEDYVKLVDLIDDYKQKRLSSYAVQELLNQAEETDPTLITLGYRLQTLEDQKLNLQQQIDQDITLINNIKPQIKNLKATRADIWEQHKLEKAGLYKRYQADKSVKNVQITANKENKEIAKEAYEKYLGLIKELQHRREDHLIPLRPYFTSLKKLKNSYRAQYTAILNEHPELFKQYRALADEIIKVDPSFKLKLTSFNWIIVNPAEDEIPEQFAKRYAELHDRYIQLTQGVYSAFIFNKKLLNLRYADVIEEHLTPYCKIQERLQLMYTEAFQNWKPTQRTLAKKNSELYREIQQLYAEYNKDKEELYTLVKELLADTETEIAALRQAQKEAALRAKRNVLLKQQTHADWYQTKQETFARRSEIRNNYVEHIKSIDIQEPFKAQMEFQRQLNNATEKHRQNILTSFLVLSPEEMQKELAFRGRIVMFAKESYANDEHMQRLFQQVSSYKKTDLEQLGIHIVDDDQGFTIIYLDKTQEVAVLNGRYYLNGNPIERTMNTLGFDEFKDVDEHLYKEFQNWGNTLTELSGHSPYTSCGDIMDEELYSVIYNGFGEERLADLSTQAASKQLPIPEYYKGLPDAVKKELPTIEELKQAGIFEQYLFNESILGSADQVRRIQAYTSKNIIKTMKNSMEQVGVHLQTKVEYIENLTDSVFSIAEGAYKNWTDEQLLEMLVRNPRYRLVYLKADKKWGMKVTEIPALNVKAIREARRLKAVVLPQDVYVKMVNVVNHRLGGSGFFKLWNRIMYLYKMGYLFNPGTIARNWIDTNLKTDLELGIEARGFKRMARDYIRQYKEVTQYVADTHDKLITRKGIEEYFTMAHDGITIDKDTYMMLDDFFRNGPVTDIFDELRYSEIAETDMWRTFTNQASKIMDWANQTEEINRLALYLSDLNKGVYKHAAWEHISKVHFDYAFKTPFEQFTEAFLPFSTFAVRNIHYWIETLMKHPEFVGLFRDVYTPIWNFDDLTPEQLQYARSLQYQIINGNINLFDINDTEYIARINPSIFDAFGSIINPIQAVQNKLAAPIQTGFDMLAGEMPTTEDLPIIGTVQQRITKAIKEKNALPSILTKRTQNAPRYTIWRNNNLNNYYGIENTSNPYYVLPKTRSDTRIDPLRTIGIRAFTSRYMTKPKVKVNVYNDVKWSHKQNVYSGIKYQLRLNINKFR